MWSEIAYLQPFVMNHFPQNPHLTVSTLGPFLTSVHPFLILPPRTPDFHSTEHIVMNHVQGSFLISSLFQRAGATDTFLSPPPSPFLLADPQEQRRRDLKDMAGALHSSIQHQTFRGLGGSSSEPMGSSAPRQCCVTVMVSESFGSCSDCNHF